MGFLAKFASILVVSATTAALPQLVSRDNNPCSENMTKVIPWESLTASEQSAYLEATLCLMQQPAKLNLGGATSLWGEMQYIHIFQVSWLHYVGAFLPWHRYYLSVHRTLLRDECGYTGPLTYWNEEVDSQLSSLSDAAVFQENAFGSSGSGTNECITNGPFFQITLDFTPGSAFSGSPVSTDSDTCIFRNLDVSNLAGSSLASVNQCLEKEQFVDMWPCIEFGPHAAGHMATGGLMDDTAHSPGDPIFFLHHAWVDLLWWRWQIADPNVRLQAIGGTNQESQQNSVCEVNPNCGDQSVIDYFGDGGNTTTLNHNLWMMDIMPNLTIADVMSTSSPYVCFDYQW